MLRDEQGEAEPRMADGIAEAYGFSRAMARALDARGLTDRAEIDRFLQPRLADLTDPFALPGMEKAVELILSHIEQGSSILVYGDYDVDGVTATALMIQVLSGLGAMAVPFLPLLLWCGLAAALRADGLNRDRIPASSFHDKRRYPAG